MTISEPTIAPTGDRSDADLVADAHRLLDATETWQIGRVTVTKFVEMAVAIPGELLMPNATVGAVTAHRGDLGPYATDEGLLTFGVHGFVLDDGERRILVDGGVGNAKPRDEPWFDRLDTSALATMADAGYPPEAIDAVVATHLHLDHVGWFTIDGDRDGDGETRWVPTFPNARHLVVREELAHWRGSETHLPHLADSVEPVFEADLIDQVRPDHAITEEIRLLPTPGHSPGHVSVLITSEGASAVITGDLLHHPIQVLEPGWDGPFDEDTAVSAATRSAFLAQFADTGTLVLGTHVATPTAGRIVTTPTGWRWDAATASAPEPDRAAGRGASAPDRSRTGASGRRVADDRKASFRFWAEGYAAVIGLSELVREAGIESSLLELVRLRASQVNGCASCIDMHSKDARAAGETEQRLYALSAWRDTPFFSDRERSALALTEAVTLVADTHVPNGVVDDAAEHFAPDELAKLVYAIVEINAWNRLAITFGAPEPGSYQPPAP